MNLALYPAKELPHLLAGTLATEQANALGSWRHWLDRFFIRRNTGTVQRADLRSRGPQLRMSTLAYPVLITPSIIFFFLAGRWTKHYACKELLSAGYPNLDAPLFWIC